MDKVFIRCSGVHRALYQTWRIMRICLFLITVCLFQARAERVLAQRITLHQQQTTLKELFKEIRLQLGYHVVWPSEKLDENTVVQAGFHDAPLDKVLLASLSGLDATYTIKEKTIVIKEAPAPRGGGRSGAKPRVSGNGPVLVLVFPEVRGLVVDSLGAALPGASVRVKGYRLATKTDQRGAYLLRDVPDDALLEISYVGYITQEVKAAPNVPTIILRAAPSALEEVEVNAGYYTVKDRERTGNISRVTAETIQQQPINNPLGAMIGRMPGVQVTQQSGVPGGAFSIQIRGRNSLRAEGNAPLYLINGVPFTSNSMISTVGGGIIQNGSPLVSINPDDIESIEVLKDADATAIYGSRGANGVVLITTKKGKAGKTRYGVDFMQGIGKVPQFLDLLNTQQYVEMRTEALKNDGLWDIREFLHNDLPDIFIWDTTRYTDWQRELIGGTAQTTNARLSVSGGNEDTQFAFGGGYYRESTVYPGSGDLQRLSGNLNLNHASSDKRFHANISVNYSVNRNDMVAGDFTGTAFTLAPTAPALYTAEGELNWDWENWWIQNPLGRLNNRYDNNTNNLVANGDIGYRILPGLNFRTRVGYTTMQVQELSISPLSARPPQFRAGTTGTSQFGANSINTWIIEPQIDYAKSLGAGTLAALVGATFQESRQEGNTITATGYTSDALLGNILAAPNRQVTSANYAQYRYAALYGRLNYTWKDRYIINATGRRDGSSRFGPGRQFGNFGAVGAAWVFTNEDFIKNGASFISYGKLRASFGTTGSDAIGNYQYLHTYSATTYPYNGTTGLYLTRLYNPDYAWETNRKVEAGLELGLIRDRIFVSASWYRNRSSNQLVGLPLSVITGQPSVQFNLPATVENRGWEFELNTTNIGNQQFRWTTAINFTLPKNELLAFPNLEAFPAYRNLYQVGKSVYTLRTLKSTGVNPQTGVYTFEDVNGDGSISTATDGQFLKEIAQQYYGGINNGFNYKEFQLDIFFQFVKQTGRNYYYTFQQPGAFSNQPASVHKRWQTLGDVTDIQQYTLIGAGAAAYVNNMLSDNAISDASFLRLKTVSLSWELPAKIMNKARMTNGRIFLQGQNLFTITNFLGMDPENQNLNALPPLRMMTIGTQITF